MDVLSRPIEMITKFEQFSDYLEDSIRKGRFKPGEKIPSERDFARRFGMSHMTVNKAVAGLVARNLLRRIHGEGTYVSEAPRTLVSRTVVSIIETRQEHHAQFIGVLPGMLALRDYSPAVYDMWDAVKIKESLRDLLQDAPKGVIIDGTALVPYDILDDLAAETHLVFINRFEGRKRYDASYVISDYFEGGCMAVRHLLGLGRRRLMVAAPHFKPGWTAELYVRGATKALDEAGLLKSAVFLHEDSPSDERLAKIFSPRTRPDGIVSLSDSLLMRVGKFAQGAGLRVPDDVATIGYFNTPWAEASDMTSLSIRAGLICEKAVESITSGRKINMKVKPEFVFRKSCPAG